MNRMFLGNMLTLVLVSAGYCQWEPEVLLHRQGDRPGWFYERVEGLGDWTGDGIDDFAVLTGTLAIDLWWGGPSLSLDPDTTIYRPDSSYFYNFKRAGDLTGDGISEFVVACWDHLLVYRGGRGQVEVLQVLQLPEIDLTDMAVPGDISGDGIPDLVLGNCNWNHSRGQVRVYLGTPTGFEGPVDSMEGTQVSFGLMGWGLTAGADVDGDGLGDFACTFNYYDTTFVLFHPSLENYLGNYEIFKGNFAALIPRAYQSARPALVLAYRNVALTRNVLYVHLGGEELDTIPDAAFPLPELLYASIPAYAGDVNRDGWGDWLAGSDQNFGNLGAFVLFLGGPWISNYSYGHGGFGGYWGEGKHLNGVGDVNGDGIDDFAMICNDDTTGHHQYGQIVVFAGDEEWHVAADDRRATPVRSSVAIQAYPNPANMETRIKVLGVPQGRAVVEVWNVLGQRVWRREVQASGGHVNLTWRMQDARGQRVAAGVYFIQVIQRGVSLTRHKILVTR